MTGPSLRTAPKAAEIEAIECPIERATAIGEVARRCGTLSPVLHRLRREALATARRQHSAGSIALRVGMSRSRVFQLTRTLATPSAPEVTP